MAFTVSVVSAGGNISVQVFNTGPNIVIVERIRLDLEFAGGGSVSRFFREADFALGVKNIEPVGGRTMVTVTSATATRARAFAAFHEVDQRARSGFVAV